MSGAAWGLGTGLNHSFRRSQAPSTPLKRRTSWYLMAIIRLLKAGATSSGDRIAMRLRSILDKTKGRCLA